MFVNCSLLLQWNLLLLHQGHCYWAIICVSNSLRHSSMGNLYLSWISGSLFTLLPPPPPYWERDLVPSVHLKWGTGVIINRVFAMSFLPWAKISFILIFVYFCAFSFIRSCFPTFLTLFLIAKVSGLWIITYPCTIQTHCLF